MNLFGIARIEIRQNLKLTLTLIVVSLLFGAAISTVIQVERKVATLALPIRWGAELAIIPKGLTLEQVAENLISGHAPALLPLAMFETTVDLTRGSVQLSAVLPGHSDGQAFLMTRGDSKLNLDWSALPKKPWQSQVEYSTPDWGTNVIAAAFASGSHESLVKLKDLVDRKTVAQAFLIEETQFQAREKQAQIARLATITEGIVVFTLLLTFYLASSWLLENHRSTQISLRDIGFTRRALWLIRLELLVVLVALPLLFGILATPQLV